MGLDIVEDCFGLEIPDEVAASLDTPGKLKHYVSQHFRTRQIDG